MSWGNPHANPRAIVLRYGDARLTVCLVDDNSTVRIDGSEFAISGLTDIALENRAIAELEADVHGAVDLGTPVSEWGKK